MFNRDALCPKNVLSYKYDDILTNLGPISVDLIFDAPKEANLGF